MFQGSFCSNESERVQFVLVGAVFVKEGVDSTKLCGWVGPDLQQNLQVGLPHRERLQQDAVGGSVSGASGCLTTRSSKWPSVHIQLLASTATKRTSILMSL